MRIKKIIFAILLAISAAAPAVGQVNEDAFKKAVDYVNCKTVEVSLKSNADILQQYQQNCPCKTAGVSEINNFLSSVGGYNVTIALANEIELLKKSFNKSWKVEDASKFLTETIFSDKNKYQKLYSFADKRKNDASFTTFKSDLKKELLPILSAKAEASNSSVQATDTQTEKAAPSLEERVKALEEKPEPRTDEKGWFDGFTFQIDVFSILISVMLMFIVLKLVYGSSDGGSDVSENIKSYIRGKINEAQFKSGGNSNSGASSFEVKNLKDEIDKLKTEIKNLSYKIESNKIPFEIVQPKYEQSSWQDTKQPEVKTETFFLSNPNSDGTFNDSSASNQYKEGASIYRFIKIGNNRAKFQIDEREASVKLALQYPDKSIDPVCDATNAFNPKAKRIVTESPGDAELIGEKWVKNTKAKIRYES